MAMKLSSNGHVKLLEKGCVGPLEVHGFESVELTFLGKNWKRAKLLGNL